MKILNDYIMLADYLFTLTTQFKSHISAHLNGDQRRGAYTHHTPYEHSLPSVLVGNLCGTSYNQS